MPSLPSRRALLPLLALIVAIVSGCVRTASPEGWAPPLAADDGALLLSLKKGHLSSVRLLSPAGPVTVDWTFPNDALEADKDLDPKGIYPSPILTPTAIFVATFAEGVFALDPAAGTQLWHRTDLGENIISAFALTPDGMLAVGTSDGRLHLLQPDSGDSVPTWPATGIPLDDGIWASLIPTPDSLIVATMGGDVLAIDYGDGHSLWPTPFHADGAILDLALLPGGDLFVPSLDGHVYLVSSALGQQLAAIETSDWVWMQPAIGDDNAFFGDLGGNVYALDITSRTLTWRAAASPGDNLPSVERIKARPALIAGKLIVADRAPAVHFLDPETGRRLNRVPIDSKTVRAPLTELDGAGLVLGTDGKLFRANPADLSVVPIPFGGTP